jgi:predicted nucleotidyltransferase component of viral defense system
MISLSHIIKWRDHANWVTDEQIEQDLILSRILVEIFSDNLLKNELAFRGGTALHKLFFNPAARYSEDIDLVRTSTGPIKMIIDAIRDRPDNWLGQPTSKRNEGRFTLYYSFIAETPTAPAMKIKIETNTREHASLFGSHDKEFQIDNPWFSGRANIKTYLLEELLGTKLRALYQRKKGRDLFDLALALSTTPNLDIAKVIRSFDFYLAQEDKKISRAQFEENFFAKIQDIAFLNDMKQLAQPSKRPDAKLPATFVSGGLDMKKAAKDVYENFITQLPGNPWKSKKFTDIFIAV